MSTDQSFEMQHGGDRLFLMFDTSALNRLADDAESASLVSRIASKFHFRLGFPLLSEVAATADIERRESLSGLCRRLLAGADSSDCLEPVDEILQKHVQAFEAGSPYSWCKVDVRLPEEVERNVRNGVPIGAASSRQVLRENQSGEEEFKRIFGSAKAEFDNSKRRGTEWPESATEFVRCFEQWGPAFWKIAASLYGSGGGRSAEQALVRGFHCRCTPFRAMVAAIWVAIFDRCVRPANVSPSLRTGRVDTFTAIYLPYADVFVTDDQGQLRCFREVSSIAAPNVTISTF